MERRGHRSSGLTVPADAVPPFFSGFFKSGATASASTYKRVSFFRFDCTGGRCSAFNLDYKDLEVLC